MLLGIEGHRSTPLNPPLLRGRPNYGKKKGTSLREASPEKKRVLVVHRTPTRSGYRSVKRVTELSAMESSAVAGLLLDLRHVFVGR